MCRIRKDIGAKAGGLTTPRQRVFHFARWNVDTRGGGIPTSGEIRDPGFEDRTEDA
jgi:hypothetical protein